MPESRPQQCSLFVSVTRVAIGLATIVFSSNSSFGADSAKAEPSRAGVEFFEQKIRPVLVKHCYECHSVESKGVKGGLLVDSRDAIRGGGDSGHSLVPGDPSESLIIDALKYESFEMPPSGRLPDHVIADFEKWIKMGAPDPRDALAKNPAETPEIDFRKSREFWSFQKPTRHRIPDTEKKVFADRPIDAFVLAQLESAGLSPNPPADRMTLARRLHLVLLGLPPSREEIRQFLNDSSDRAFERLVDRVLSSPHYGERLGRLWLDVSRYAEDQAHVVGNNKSLFYPNAWMYRDWVIDALNSDMPYDEFIRLQLAADLIEPENEDVHVALGFVGLGPKYYRRNDPEVMADEWENHVDTISRGLLGMTIACARCHDHKYDPIPTEDYYALAGVFASTTMFNRPLKREESEPQPEDEKEKAKKDKSPEFAMHIIKDGKPLDLNVQIRGDVKNKGDVVPRGFPRILSEDNPILFKKGSGRQELADAITSRDNPLTARVIVNRVWGLLVGRPLVGTPSNFGILGEKPTHPRLLDDLSVRFMENGWSLKWLCREIVLSSTWQQSSDIVAEKQQADPANRLLWRMSRRRLDAEAWRDVVLASAGRLDRTIGGKSMEPTEPEETRRTVYSRISRLELNPMLAMFDHPDPNVHADRRVETTTPLQKMFLLNSPFMVRQAEALANRTLQACTSDKDRIAWVTEELFGRSPTREEIALGLEFIGAEDGGHNSRWEQFAQVLLASNELLMID